MSKLVITLDSTALRSFMTCEQQWAYAYVENLRRFNETTIYLDKGTLVHKLLEVFYTLRALRPREDRYAHQKIVVDLFKKGKLLKTSGLDKTEEDFICGRFLQYVMKYMSYDFVPQMRNGKVGVEIGFSKVLYEDEQVICIVEGKIDLLSKTPHPNGGFDCFVDNKSQEQKKDLYPYKIQFLTYAWATGFRWGYINYFRLQEKYSETETFRRELIYFDAWQVEKWKSQALKVFFKVYETMIKYQIDNQDDLKGWMFNQNLNSCAGPDEKRPCYFTKICENPGKDEAIKKVYYDKVAKWVPWNKEELSLEI